MIWSLNLSKFFVIRVIQSIFSLRRGENFTGRRPSQQPHVHLDPTLVRFNINKQKRKKKKKCEIRYNKVNDLSVYTNNLAVSCLMETWNFLPWERAVLVVLPLKASPWYISLSFLFNNSICSSILPHFCLSRKLN